EGSDQFHPGLTVTDAAGNVSAATAGFTGINVDLTRPTVSAAATSAANANGWDNHDVTVPFTAGDNLSGVAAPTDHGLSNQGVGSSSTAVTVTDVAGNVSLPSNVVTVNIDKTAPTVSLGQASGAYSSGAGFSWISSDTPSGVASTRVTVDGTQVSTDNSGTLA